MLWRSCIDIIPCWWCNCRWMKLKTFTIRWFIHSKCNLGYEILEVPTNDWSIGSNYVMDQKERTWSWEEWLIINISNPQLKDKLKLPLQEGWTVKIEDIDNKIDPILEKQVIVKGRTKLIRNSDTEMDYSDKFMFSMINHLSNSHFSPELETKTTIINFTIIQSG